MSELFISIGQVRVETLFAAYLLLLFSGLLTAYFCRSKETFAAWSVAAVGIFLLALFANESLSWREIGGFICLSLVVSGGVFLLLTFALFLRRWGKRSAALRAGRKRRLEFTLPDKKNEYLRERLDNVLKAREEERSEAGVELEYVRGLLARLKAAPLAAVERMQTEELSRQITLYSSKEGLTADEKRGLGDCFSALINLAAKYGI